jgi:hypothetical protein
MLSIHVAAYSNGRDDKPRPFVMSLHHAILVYPSITQTGIMI